MTILLLIFSIFKVVLYLKAKTRKSVQNFTGLYFFYSNRIFIFFNIKQKNEKLMNNKQIIDGRLPC